MDPETFYALIDGQLQRVATYRTLPAAFLNAVPTNVDTILDIATMTIGVWQESAERPLVLALDGHGELLAVVAVNADEVNTLGENLRSMDEWLASMRLRDLSDLSGDHVAFYEGLWDLSPDAPIALAPTRHYILLTAIDELSVEGFTEEFPNARFSVRYFDTVVAPGHPALVRSRPAGEHATPPLVAVAAPPPPPLEVVHSGEPDGERPRLEPVQDIERMPQPVVELAPMQNPGIQVVSSLPPMAQGDGVHSERQPEDFNTEAQVIDLISGAPEHDIDLNGAAEEIVSEDAAAPLADHLGLDAGATYDIGDLPLLFDPSGASLLSISDELFAVDRDIVLVAKLDGDRSPIEGPDRFRWETSTRRSQLLDEQLVNHRGVSRVLRLFVESSHQPEYATYVGVLKPSTSVTSNVSVTSSSSESAWFSIEPAIDSEMYRLFSQGLLPQHDIRTVDETIIG